MPSTNNRSGHVRSGGNGGFGSYDIHLDNFRQCGVHEVVAPKRIRDDAIWLGKTGHIQCGLLPVELRSCLGSEAKSANRYSTARTLSRSLDR